MTAEILKPVVALIAWTLVMWVWLYATRLPAMSRARVDGFTMVGSSGGSLRDQLIAAGEERASWTADNYNHLMEQPTLFYAVALVLAVTGAGDGVHALIAWGYVALRVAHSIVQATWNRVVVRFALFSLSTFCLIALTLHAAMTVF